MTEEGKIQKKILAILKDFEDYGFVYHFRSQVVQKGIVKSGKKGLPDITCCIKGRFVGIEVKSVAGTQKPEQIKAQEKIEKAGGEYYIVRDAGEVVKIINEKIFGRKKY